MFLTLDYEFQDDVQFPIILGTFTRRPVFHQNNQDIVRKVTQIKKKTIPTNVAYLTRYNYFLINYISPL